MLEEGEVEAGEEIVKVASGAEQMSVAEINALLYLPGHRREELERALRIPALSAGWKGSFQALLQQGQARQASGIRGSRLPTFRSRRPPGGASVRMRVAAKARESADVISLVFEPADALPLATPLAGQFIVLRLQPARETSPLLRSYSLSGAPNAAQYRVSIKCEVAGAASAYLDRQVARRRHARGERAARQLHARTGRASARAGERRHRHHAGAGDTARAGRRAFDTARSGGFTARATAAHHPFARGVARTAAPPATCAGAESGTAGRPPRIDSAPISMPPVI